MKVISGYLCRPEKFLLPQMLVTLLVIGEDAGGLHGDDYVGDLLLLLVEAETAGNLAEHAQHVLIADMRDQEAKGCVFRIDPVIARCRNGGQG